LAVDILTEFDLDQKNYYIFIYILSSLLKNMPEHQVTILVTKEVVEERTVSVTASDKAEAESEAVRMVRKDIENEKDYDTVIKLSIANGKDRHDENSSKKNETNIP
tara:strand:- start:1457 stop:1774 length:318 start_codon:yes stop_codon:yes gene_type:complete